MQTQQQQPNSHNIIVKYFKKEYRKEYNWNLYNYGLNMQYQILLKMYSFFGRHLTTLTLGTTF